MLAIDVVAVASSSSSSSFSSHHCTAAAAASAMSSSSPEMERSSSKKYKGVRKRKWGKWVSEIRLPNSRERIWLGSYDAPEKAARAFDAAFVCLRGPGAAGADLNFPDSPPPCRAGGCSSDPQEVQAAALSHANRAAVTAQQAAAALMDVDDGPALPPWDSLQAHDMADVLGTGISAEVVAPAVRADGSIDWRPFMAHPPPLFSPTGWAGGNAYDFLLQVPPPPPPPPCAADEDMEDSVHGTSASLWSFDLRDSYFRY